MALYDELGPMSFGGIEFPYVSVRVRGGIRDHIHEFPHTPGGEPEKMGRKLYVMDVEGIFYRNLRDPKWETLWPDRLSALMRLFENQETKDLHIPTVGTIPAYCREWDRAAVAKIRSGESAGFQFVEHQESLELTKNAIKISPANLGSQMNTLDAETLEAGEDPSIWDALREGVNDIIAIKDGVEMNAALIESKIQWVTSICQQADATLEQLQNPDNWGITEALKDLWASTRALAENFTEESGALRTYTLPVAMSTSQIAAEVYGDAGKGGEILTWNAITDPFNVRAGTKIKYFAES
jgi:DNA circularisation protein N-terminus